MKNSFQQLLVFTLVIIGVILYINIADINTGYSSIASIKKSFNNFKDMLIMDSYNANKKYYNPVDEDEEVVKKDQEKTSIAETKSVEKETKKVTTKKQTKKSKKTIKKETKTKDIKKETVQDKPKQEVNKPVKDTPKQEVKKPGKETVKEEVKKPEKETPKEEINKPTKEDKPKEDKSKEDKPKEEKPREENPKEEISTKVKDVFLLNLNNNTVMESGDIDQTTGSIIDDRNRVRTKDEYIIKNDIYNIYINNPYVLTIYEYDSNHQFIKTVRFEENSTYKPTSEVKYFKVSLKGNSWDVEKKLSPGQWSKMYSVAGGRIEYGDLEAAKNSVANLTIDTPFSASSVDIRDTLLIEDVNASEKLWNALVKNGVYNLDDVKTNNRTTYYFSPDGDDNNSGLLKEYPKKDLSFIDGINDINVLLECGKTYYVDSGISIGSNVTIASYGYGSRPVLSFYRPLNKTFTQISDNLYVADISDVDRSYTNDKNDYNIGQLLINGSVNWKRVVYSNKESYRNELLTDKQDDWSWCVDFQNGKLYFYTTSNPNVANISYAPGTTALYSTNGSNITIKGIEIVGAGKHGINLTNTSNVNLFANSFKYIGGSVLAKAGVRYGNAIQLWNSAENISIRDNIAIWIFDTCYTNQGSGTVRNVTFRNNIGLRANWGLETSNGSTDNYSDIDYSNNLLIRMGDITNPYTKMEVTKSGHLYGEKTTPEYISYRTSYTFHQGSTLAIWGGEGNYVPNIHDNIFYETNRYLVIGTWYQDEVSIPSLYNNLFYEEYVLGGDRWNQKPALFKFNSNGNHYFEDISSITPSGNMVSINKKGTYDNTNELIQMSNLIDRIILNQ